MNKFEASIHYIVQFLLQKNARLSTCVHYVTLKEAVSCCNNQERQIYIIKSGFFTKGKYGQKESMPEFPLSAYCGVRILYGIPKEERIHGNSILIYADIIASAYFLLTRYEEYIYPELRDMHGRFPPKESSLYISGGSLHAPLVDQYGKILCQKLATLGYDIKKEKPGFSKIYFTHDIDAPYIQYSFVRMLGAIVKRALLYRKFVIYPFQNWRGNYVTNVKATWNYMLEKEKQASRKVSIPMESICFIIATEESDSYTVAYINDRKANKALMEMRDRDAKFGLHTSYAGADDPQKMRKEKEKLEEILGISVQYQRNHYLRQIHPSDIKRYEDAGFTDDFTTGYAEMPGFRLGTCHPVRWIDPADGRLHKIILHPLLIMDGTLSAKDKMGLSYEKAQEECQAIISQTWNHRGEINVLFHNGMFEDLPGNYQKELYDWMLEYITALAVQSGNAD